MSTGRHTPLAIACENGHAAAIDILLSRGAQKPPQKAKDGIYCYHEECEADPPAFRRCSEWNEHMDEHERPYKCTQSRCEKLQGFAYSGSMLRHQHEVHKKNGTTIALIFCSEPTAIAIQARASLREKIPTSTFANAMRFNQYSKANNLHRGGDNMLYGPNDSQ
jgi:hypothetical protein